MSYVAGDVVAAVIRERKFDVPSGSEATIDPGGRKRRVEHHGIGSGGEASSRVVFESGGWSIAGLQLAIDHYRSDLEWLRDLSNRSAFGSVFNPFQGTDTP